MMWPKLCLPSINSDDIERKQKYRVTLFAPLFAPSLDPERFSDWFKYLRVLAYVMRFIQNGSMMAKVRGPLAVEEINDAGIMVLHQAQQVSYSDELSKAGKGEAFLQVRRYHLSLQV